MKQASSAIGPRYLSVAEELKNDIAQGVYPVGSLLMPELQLSEKYGVSRQTVRAAIRTLVELNLLTRRSGVGTTVVSKLPPSRYTASVSDITELFQYYKDTKLEVRSEAWVTLDESHMDFLPGRAGQSWYWFETCRHTPESSEPFVHTEIYVHPMYAAVRNRINEPDITVYRLLEELHGAPVERVRQEIGCSIISNRAANVLGLPEGMPALQVIRYYIAANDFLLSLSINTYVQDRFKLVTEWSATSQEIRPGY